MVSSFKVDSTSISAGPCGLGGNCGSSFDLVVTLDVPKDWAVSLLLVAFFFSEVVEPVFVDVSPGILFGRGV